MKKSTPNLARSALLSVVLASCILSVAMPAQATIQAEQRRQARDLRQDVRQESREQKQDCRQEEFLGNAECRQEHRHNKQEARQEAREIKY